MKNRNTQYSLNNIENAHVLSKMIRLFNHLHFDSQTIAHAANAMKRYISAFSIPQVIKDPLLRAVNMVTSDKYHVPTVVLIEDIASVIRWLAVVSDEGMRDHGRDIAALLDMFYGSDIMSQVADANNAAPAEMQNAVQQKYPLNLVLTGLFYLFSRSLAEEILSGRTIIARECRQVKLNTLEIHLDEAFELMDLTTFESELIVLSAVLDTRSIRLETLKGVGKETVE